MASDPQTSPGAHAAESDDAMESVVRLIPIVLPVLGGLLMLLLAFIAVYLT